MKIAIVQFPGSNCERESILAVNRAGMEAVEFFWNGPEETLKDFDGYFLIGGFSYEDRSRAGIIASLDSIMGIIREQAEKGKPVLGICNGAQILVETGLVPGLKSGLVAMALATNQRLKDGHVLGTGYYNAWINVQLTADGYRCAFTRHLKRRQYMTVPVAHAQGRFMMPKALLEELNERHQTVFRYCDNDGNLSPEFPVNPNGSMDNLAAVCNPGGNVMAMMPHPERTPDGDPIFTSMRDSIREAARISTTTPVNDPPEVPLHEYTPPENSFELLVDLIITDNEAVSVENALHHLEVPVTVTRRTHWEVTRQRKKTGDLKREIIMTGELFNSNKESLVTPGHQRRVVSLLVRYKDDMEGQHKREVLENWFHIEGIQSIKKGVVWTITPQEGTSEDALLKILDTHILFNPYSHDCFRYA
ncbi:MAG: phosphoribosylformylglycinamidine synthase I [Candidatus Neomarinimicrobiota bacterium]